MARKETKLVPGSHISRVQIQIQQPGVPEGGLNPIVRFFFSYLTDNTSVKIFWGVSVVRGICEE